MPIYSHVLAYFLALLLLHLKEVFDRLLPDCYFLATNCCSNRLLLCRAPIFFAQAILTALFFFFLPLAFSSLHLFFTIQTYINQANIEKNKAYLLYLFFSFLSD